MINLLQDYTNQEGNDRNCSVKDMVRSYGKKDNGLQNDLIQFKHHNSIFAGGKNNFLSYAKIAFIHLAKLFV